jgi:hypothetical protein
MTLNTPQETVGPAKAIAPTSRRSWVRPKWLRLSAVGSFFRLFFNFFLLSSILLWIHTLVNGNSLDEYKSMNISADITAHVQSHPELAQVLGPIVFYPIVLLADNTFNGAWPILVSSIAALALIVFEGRLSRFWLVALSWGSACVISDVVCGRLSLYLLEPLGLNIAIGFLMAWLFSRPLQSIPFVTNRSFMRRDKISPAPEELLLYDYYYPDKLRINTWSVATGLCVIALTADYWISLLLFVVLLTVFWSDILFITVIPLFQAFFFMLLTGFFWRMLFFPLFFISVIFSSVSLGNKIYRHAKNVLLLYRSKAAWGYVGFLVVWLCLGNFAVFYLHILENPNLHPKLKQLALNANYILVEFVLGFLFAATMPRLSSAGPAGAWTMRLMVVQRKLKVATLLWSKRFFPASATILLQSEESNIYYNWVKAIVNPVKTVERLVSLNDNTLKIKEFRTLTASSFAISIVVVSIVAILSGVSVPDVLKGTFGRALAIAFMLVGGLACHLLLRFFRLPSELLTTLLLYAVPQALFMPILAALSFPSISLEHELLDGVRGTDMDTFNALKKMATMLPTLANRPGWSYATMAFLSGLVSGLLLIVFLELYWQKYRVPRIKAYSVGVTAWLVNFLLILLPIPIHVIVVYWLK